MECLRIPDTAGSMMLRISLLTTPLTCSWCWPSWPASPRPRWYSAILAHELTYDACAAMTRDVGDVVAESVAYAVCFRFGLALSLRSVDDVDGWGHLQGHDPKAVPLTCSVPTSC
jgi:hypothetical protein